VSALRLKRIERDSVTQSDWLLSWHASDACQKARYLTRFIWPTVVFCFIYQVS
jgi:hypothetical protein